MSRSGRRARRTATGSGARPPESRRRALAAVAGLLAAAVLGGCSGDDDPASRGTTTVASPAPRPAPGADPALAAPDPTTPGVAYLALGDSLAQGVQRRRGTYATTRAGYPDALAARLRAARTPVTLSRIGCSGATAASLADGGRDCTPPAPGRLPYENRDAATSQLAYAETYLRARGDRPTLVTIDVGANDVIGCAGIVPERVRACASERLPLVRDRLGEIARRLRAAAGPNVVLATMTYYDPAVALVRQPLAREAARAFHDVVRRRANPDIRRVFGREGFVVARVDRAFRSDGAATDAALDTTCRLTRLCGEERDFHPNAEGYGRIADAFLDVVGDPVRGLGGRDPVPARPGDRPGR